VFPVNPVLPVGPVVPVSPVLLFSNASVSALVYVVDWFAFKLSPVSVAFDIGFAESAVFSAKPSPTIALVMPDTVPVKFGLSKGALVFKDDCNAFTSGKFSTFF
jgi:hypothetical protein